ncbi:SufS family cysteine desulfurase [Patescibacteria group bacterium]|nr:SufS family cysteine desulfurase [Patescibacteria group bacterium]
MSYKQDFPIFKTYPQLAYLDNSATTQKPQAVLDAMNNYYATSCANVHRGVHLLSDLSTTAFDQSKEKIATFFGAKNHELIITRNATEALNGIAYGWASYNLHAEDVILVSLMEHHANIVPWQELSKRNHTKLVFINLTADGQIDLADFENKLNTFKEKIKLVSLIHVSNTLGTLNPIGEIVTLIKKYKINCRIAIDGAQSAPHLKINFSKMGVDFYAFSGHKMLGPMGVGGLLVKEELLQSEEMKPWLFGGGMIESVYQDQTIFNSDLSERFVAGTPDVASVVGLAAACDYLEKIGMDKIEDHERQLTNYALQELSKIPEIKIIGPLDPEKRLSSVAFVYDGVHAHDVAQVLNQDEVAVRSGHHCTMPLHLSCGWVATVRASFSVYSTTEDIDKLILALKKVKTIFK